MAILIGFKLSLGYLFGEVFDVKPTGTEANGRSGTEGNGGNRGESRRRSRRGDLLIAD